MLPIFATPAEACNLYIELTTTDLSTTAVYKPPRNSMRQLFWCNLMNFRFTNGVLCQCCTEEQLITCRFLDRQNNVVVISIPLPLSLLANWFCAEHEKNRSLWSFWLKHREWEYYDVSMVKQSVLDFSCFHFHVSCFSRVQITYSCVQFSLPHPEITFFRCLCQLLCAQMVCMLHGRS